MIRAVIFDLDGVLVTTDECHYQAWKRVAEEEGIPFDRAVNERLRGVSRMESLERILEKAPRTYTPAEKEALAARKNAYYRDSIALLTEGDLLPGTAESLSLLRERGIRTAVGSSSKNTPLILRRLGLSEAFDAVADGNAITRGKPDPEVFLLAARLLGIPPAGCLVVEDAEAGVSAALAGGMAVLGVGPAAADPRTDFSAPDLARTDWDAILK